MPSDEELWDDLAACLICDGSLDDDGRCYECGKARISQKAAFGFADPVGAALQAVGENAARKAAIASVALDKGDYGTQIACALCWGVVEKDGCLQCGASRDVAMNKNGAADAIKARRDNPRGAEDAAYASALVDVAAGLGFDLAAVAAAANRGRERLERAHGDFDAAIERAVARAEGEPLRD